MAIRRATSLHQSTINKASTIDQICARQKPLQHLEINCVYLYVSSVKWIDGQSTKTATSRQTAEQGRSDFGPVLIRLGDLIGPALEILYENHSVHIRKILGLQIQNGGCRVVPQVVSFIDFFYPVLCIFESVEQFFLDFLFQDKCLFPLTVIERRKL